MRKNTPSAHTIITAAGNERITIDKVQSRFSISTYTKLILIINQQLCSMLGLIHTICEGIVDSEGNNSVDEDFHLS